MQGLKQSQINALERLYKRRFPRDAAFSPEQAREVALLSRAIGRQIGLLIDRRGKVVMVISGQPESIYIPELPPMPRSGRRLRGLHLLHTHLIDSGLDQEDLLDLLFLRLDAVQVLTVDSMGEPLHIQSAWLVPQGGRQNAEQLKKEPYQLDALRIWHNCQYDFAQIAAAFEKEGADAVVDEDAPTERAILVSVSTEPQAIQERNLEELASLCASAGIKVRGRLAQRVGVVNPRLILGKGKLADLEIMALQGNAELIVFDGELSPAQLHNLADVTERKVIDRTQLILDIFAQHAVSRAGKLQVELAQLAYAQPRLTGRNQALDRLMGGIGGRGPGESRLETDRRKSRLRMAFLKRELEKLRRQRALVRRRRDRNRVPVVALVGYANAGKSTLLNKLTSSSVGAEDKLFATLDPATRRLRFPREREIAISDTVGFIRNLPKELREAFRATLEELESADLFLHVADASQPEMTRQIEAVEEVLEELKLQETPRLLVFNKCDRLSQDELRNLAENWPAAIQLSAATGDGCAHLLERVEKELFMRASSD